MDGVPGVGGGRRDRPGEGRRLAQSQGVADAAGVLARPAHARLAVTRTRARTRMLFPAVCRLSLGVCVRMRAETTDRVRCALVPWESGHELWARSENPRERIGFQATEAPSAVTIADTDSRE